MVGVGSMVPVMRVAPVVTIPGPIQTDVVIIPETAASVDLGRWEESGCDDLATLAIGQSLEPGGAPNKVVVVTG